MGRAQQVPSRQKFRVDRDLRAPLKGFGVDIRQV